MYAQRQHNLFGIACGFDIDILVKSKARIQVFLAIHFGFI